MNIFCGIKLILTWAAAAVVLQTAEANPSCKPRGVGPEGFTMSLYRYPYANLSTGADQCYSDRINEGPYIGSYIEDDNYIPFTGYSDYGLIGSASGITNLTMDLQVSEKCTPTLGKLPSNFNFQEEFDISNFTMVIKGYFYAETTGDYTIILKADDWADFGFNFTGYDCCG